MHRGWRRAGYCLLLHYGRRRLFRNAIDRDVVIASVATSASDECRREKRRPSDKVIRR